MGVLREIMYEATPRHFPKIAKTKIERIRLNRDKLRRNSGSIERTMTCKKEKKSKIYAKSFFTIKFMYIGAIPK